MTNCDQPDRQPAVRGPLHSAGWKRLHSGFAVAAAVLWHASLPAAGSAQVVNFRHYTSADGVPQAQVRAMAQDPKGYLWMATHAGLSRFDGVEFINYEKRDGLAANDVWDLAIDPAGRVLVATSRGACVLHHAEFRCWGVADGLPHGNSRSVAWDGRGGLWVGTQGGLAHVTESGVRNYTAAEGLPGDRIGRIVVDAADRVWIATDGGLGRLDDERFVLHSPTGDARNVEFVTAAGAGVLAGVGGLLFFWDGEHARPVAAHVFDGSVPLMDGAVDADGTIWVATRVGVYRVEGDEVLAFTRANGLRSELINRVMIDRDGVVWFGTDNGATKHVPGPFRTYTDVDGLPSAFVRAVAADTEGRLWTGGRNGLAIREGSRFRPLSLAGVPDTRVFSLAPDADGGMVVGTVNGLLLHTGTAVRRLTRRDGLPSDLVYVVHGDGAGGFWVGTDRGLAHLRDGVITRSAHPDLAGLDVMALHQDRRGRLWIGRSGGGMAVVDGDVVRLLGEADGLTDHTVWAISEDAEGRIWVGTNGDGALRIDDQGVRRFTIDDGLASNFIWQVLPDSRGRVWLFGNLGLNRFAGDTLVHYGRGAGLIELEGSAGASYEDADGTLWFGTGLGIARFTPGLELARTERVPIFIESATMDERAVPFEIGSQSRLRGGQLRIRFSSPAFRDESATRFRYRLVGADTAWSRPVSERSITYAGLAPGQYQFQVVAENRGVRSEVPAVISFQIMPAWWQTWWFSMITMLVLIGGTAAVPVWRARSLDRERLRLEALVERHTRDLAAKNAKLEASNRELEHFAYVASHDLQEPLRKIRAFSDRVSSQYAGQLDTQGRDYLGRMASAAARMQSLIDALLGLSRVSTSRVTMTPVALNPLIDDVLGDLEVRIQSTGGTVDVGTLPAVFGDEVQLRQLFQNLIGNALKFHRTDTPPRVAVTAEVMDAGTVRIRVADNGIGFAAEDASRIFLPFQRLHGRSQYEGTGIGLSICQRIVERHGGSIHAESEPGVGTQFVLTLPLQAEEVLDAA